MNLEQAVAAVVDADRQLNASSPTPFPVPATGLEAVVAGTVTALRREDWWLPGLRERIGAVLRDAPVERFHDGFAGARPYRVVPPTPSPANRALYAVGLAQGGGSAVVHLGIGSLSDGAAHEALNLAGLHGGCVVFVVAVHQLDGGAPIGRQLASTATSFAKSYGIPHVEVSGTDALAVNEAVSAALASGEPHIVFANLEPQK